MKSVLDKSAREELNNRINQLSESNAAEWGKMNVYQMAKHCVICNELYHGQRTHSRSFIGRLFGKKGLKNLLNENKPFPRSAPTSPAFKVKEETGDLATEKKNWIGLIKAYEHYPHDYTHWFFGKMTRDELGRFVYKHDDHHLRQFGV